MTTNISPSTASVIFHFPARVAHAVWHGIQIMSAQIAILALGIYLAVKNCFSFGAVVLPDESPNEAPQSDYALPTMRPATDAEKGQITDVGRIMPLPNPGNTCYLAAVVQTWLLDHEQLFRQAVQARPSEPLQTIVTFIDTYKAAREGDVDLSPLRAVLPANWGRNQQDAEEAIVTLEQFIDQELRLEQRSFAKLILEPGESLVGSQDPAKYPMRDGRAELCTNKVYMKLSRSDTAVDQTPFARIFQRAFLEGSEPIQCDVRKEDGTVVKNSPVRVSQVKELLNRSPDTFVFSLKRFRQGLALRGAIPGIDEVMEVPGDLFFDGQGASYILKGAIIQIGGTSPKSGHYYAIKRTAGGWVKANDDAISSLSPEAALREASRAYILLYKKLQSTAAVS